MIGGGGQMLYGRKLVKHSWWIKKSKIKTHTHLLALNHNLFFSDGGVTKPRILFQNVTRKTSRPDYPLGD